jgi:plasmid maintenance system killer protein
LKALELLGQDERYPSLHFKEVSAKEHAWSIRVSQDYRMVGYREGDAVTWFWIGTHGDYDKLLSRLR